MDAAEKRMRLGGFNGFSFREIASDVGIKSSSVHYHFPTKENLAAAVIRRRQKETSERMDLEFAMNPDPVQAWFKVFRATLTECRMCACIVLGAAQLDSPSEVAVAVKNFFNMCLDKLVEQGLTKERAAELLATLSGAMVLANALGDVEAYDRATSQMIKQSARPAGRLKA
ncbi:TetR/AcrR family transcriptional regulator [Sphingomonas sp. LaA6.9]|uniref:TetR/AcrR family transcriptional regulator n=1 Tax=Sphingomonas sp. LaA6.9 TaxID=2919914 RepID=UPI001F4FC507|nr:TetR/AcrR family transcriptional regulator [Sphingomonas sp. LaA6.9]MCJ8157943.1 TetR/AcrR family transcriptional regulator [Sphingomonas sp. LaA6.9]